MNWINYLLQVNLYLLLTFGFYWLVLRKETFYNANRAYMMTASLMAFAIPFWQSGIIQSWGVTEQVSTVVNTISIEEFTVSGLTKSPTWSWNLLAATIYFLGFGFGLLRFSIGLFKLQQLFKMKNLEGQAFSVFGKIFIDKNLADYKTIKAHEEVHSKDFHSIDVFWFELLGVICWFNPIAHFMQKEIKAIHEYIADDIAALSLGSKKAYATVLVSSHFKTNSNILINNFYNKSILKTRIMMLTKEKSNKKSLIKYGLIAPLFLGMLIVSAASKDEQFRNELIEVIPKTEIDLTDAPVENKTEVINVLDSDPSFPGGVAAMYKFIGENISYPIEAQQAKVEGKVFVKFIIDKNGDIRNLEILKGLGFGCDEEVKRIVNLMPKWIPGTQNDIAVSTPYTMPVFFKLE